MNFFQEVLSSLWGLSDLCKAEFSLWDLVYTSIAPVRKSWNHQACLRGTSRGPYLQRLCLRSTVVSRELHHLFNLVECVDKGHPGGRTDAPGWLVHILLLFLVLGFLGWKPGLSAWHNIFCLLLDQVDGCYGNRARGDRDPFCQHRLVCRENRV